MFTDKRFWKYILPTVIFLSIYPITILGCRLSVIGPVVVTFAIAGMCSWWVSDEDRDAPSHLWLMTWLGALCGYIIDVVILSAVWELKLLVMQLYLYPIWIAYSGLICFAGYFIRTKIYNENSFRTAVSIAMAFVGAIAAGITIGNGWSFAIWATASITATWLAIRMLRWVPDVGFAIIWKWPYKYEITQRGKSKERLEPVDYLYSFKKFLPIYVAISFIFSAALFGGSQGDSKNKKEVWHVNGLVGHITAIHYMSDIEAIALASTYGPERPDSAAIYRSVDGGHNWSCEIVLPNCRFYDNPAIRGNMLSCIVRCGECHRLLTFDMNTGEHSLSDYTLGAHAILFARKDGIYIADGSVLYKAGNQLDSIDAYDVRICNAGFAELNEGLIGFIWDNKKCCSRLYNFSKKQFVDTVAFKGSCFFIVKSVHDKAIVGGIQNNCANCYDLDASADGLKRVSSHHRYTIMSDLREDNSGTIAFIIYDGPFDDCVVKYSTDYGKSWHIKDLGVSPIEAWCILQDRVYYLSNHKMYMIKL